MSAGGVVGNLGANFLAYIDLVLAFLLLMNILSVYLFSSPSLSHHFGKTLLLVEAGMKVCSFVRGGRGVGQLARGGT